MFCDVFGDHEDVSVACSARDMMEAIHGWCVVVHHGQTSAAAGQAC